MVASSADSRIELRAFTVADFADGHNPLEGLDDPSRYLRSHDPERLELVRRNPFGRKSDITLAIVVDDGKVVGRLGFYAGPGPAWARERRVLWLSGFYLDAAYRDSGAGGMLMLRALSSQCDVLAAGAPSPNLEAVYDKIGFTRMGPLHRWVHFYNASVIAGKFVRLRWIQRTAGATAWPLLKAYHLLRRPLPAARDIEFHPVTQMPLELEELVARSDSKEAFRRGAAVWNWVLPFTRAHMPFTIYRDGKLYGYCLLQHYDSPGGGSHHLPAMRIGALVDYHVPDDALTADVLRFARGHFARAGCDVFEVQCRHPNMEAFARQSGMVRLGGYRIFYRPRSSVNFDKDRQWRFTSAVADMTLTGVFEPLGG